MKKGTGDLPEAKTMMNLTDLGFTGGVIFETIVTTSNPNGTPNAAPMGVIMQDQSTLILNIFNQSKTLQNLKTQKKAVINITSNIELFYKSTFKEANPDGKLPLDWFEKSTTVKAPKLRLADAWVEASVVSVEANGREKTHVHLKVEAITAQQKFPQIYNRAFAAVLEAIINATRVKAFAADPNQQAEVGKLLGLIDNCCNVVGRVAPNSAYSVVLADLMVRIDLWRLKH